MKKKIIKYKNIKNDKKLQKMIKKTKKTKKKKKTKKTKKLRKNHVKKKIAKKNFTLKPGNSIIYSPHLAPS